MYDIHLFLWWHCDRSEVDDMRRWTTLMWRRTTSKYRRSASVDKNVADPKVLTSRRQDQHLIDTVSGRCSWCWRYDVRTCPQRRRRRRETTTSIQSNVRGRDVTWRDVTSTESSWIGGRSRSDSSWPTQLRHFITIWFESYIVVSQAFWL